MTIDVRVQADAFDVGVELAAMRRQRPEVGAIASFIGIVRDVNDVGDSERRVGSLTLEHYPGMTERALEAICQHAIDRWPVIDVCVVHRIGTLQPTDPIVLVAVSASHRGDAFAACHYVMDLLKTEAPFWKKETTPSGERWVGARDSDVDALARWQPDGKTTPA